MSMLTICDYLPSTDRVVVRVPIITVIQHIVKGSQEGDQYSRDDVKQKIGNRHNTLTIVIYEATRLQFSIEKMFLECILREYKRKKNSCYSLP